MRPTRAHRVIVGLTAAMTCASPWPSEPRFRGTKGAGIRFEKAAAAKIKGCIRGQWFKYTDANGVGYCCPDILLPVEGHTLILECKLTEVEQARMQLAELYSPVIRMAFDRPTASIVVARHLTKETNTALVVDSLKAAIGIALRGFVPTLHWLGRGPI